MGCATLILIATGLGCGGDGVALPPDGGDTSPSCSGSTTCEGTLVRACHNGEVGAPLYNCEREGACSNGRCMTPACATAERDLTGFAGCFFYAAETDNVASDADTGTSFLVTNPGTQPAVAVLQRLGPGGTWMQRLETVVDAGTSARLSRPAEMRITEAGLRIAGALRVWSNQPVTVEQIQSDDSDERAFSTGGTMLLPVHVLGLRYRVMTYAQVETPKIAATAMSAGGAGRVLVVGTQAGTTVSFRRSPTVSSAVTGLPQPVATAADAFELGDGDVFQIWTASDRDDLSGSAIESNFPVAVFAGNISTTYGRMPPGIHSPDMAHEQMPPLAAWNLKYVAAALPPRVGACDTLLGAPEAPPGASVWRLLADRDGTRLRFAVPDGAPAVHPDIELDAGEVLEVIYTGDFVVSASEPILMTQGIDCEPSLSLAIPADKALEDVRFAVLPWFDQVVAVARPQGELVLFDGMPIDDTSFAPAGDGYEVARVSVPTCDVTERVCTHRLQGRFGMSVRGMDVLASYATTVPAWTGCSDPDKCGP